MGLRPGQELEGRKQAAQADSQWVAGAEVLVLDAAEQHEQEPPPWELFSLWLA